MSTIPTKFLEKSSLALKPSNLKKLNSGEYAYQLNLMRISGATFEDMMVYTTLFLLSMKSTEIEVVKDDLYDFIKANEDILIPLTKTQIKKYNAAA